MCPGAQQSQLDLEWKVSKVRLGQRTSLSDVGAHVRRLGKRCGLVPTNGKLDVSIPGSIKENCSQLVQVCQQTSYLHLPLSPFICSQALMAVFASLVVVSFFSCFASQICWLRSHPGFWLFLSLTLVLHSLLVSQLGRGFHSASTICFRFFSIHLLLVVGWVKGFCFSSICPTSSLLACLLIVAWLWVGWDWGLWLLCVCRPHYSSLYCQLLVRIWLSSTCFPPAFLACVLSLPASWWAGIPKIYCAKKARTHLLTCLYLPYGVFVTHQMNVLCLRSLF